MKRKYWLLVALVPSGTAWGRNFFHFPRMSHTPKSSVSFYDLINDIKNLIDHILVFIQENGGWIIIALMLVAVFATCLKKKQDKNDKHSNDED
ncbi:MAG TPA: hypothetical protein DCZ76_03220 [Treponema sp.]|nr:hypothetical protein [Treponema sp.]